MFSTIGPKIHNIELGDGGHPGALIDTIGFVTGFTQITAEIYRTTIQAILISDYVIHIGTVSEIFDKIKNRIFYKKIPRILGTFFALIWFESVAC
mgnify:CR=1 FL=1